MSTDALRSVPAPPAGGHRPLAWIAIGLGLAVLGLRWCLLDRFGYDVPYWPEWRGAGMLLFKPWAEDRLTWDHLFSLHNEHRHVLPRLWSLGFFAINGRWDPTLVQAANAAVAALNAALLVWFAGRSAAGLTPRWLLLAAGLALLAPFDYADLLVGYPAEFFFYITLTVVAVACWTTETLTLPRLLGGAACAALAPLTVAAGPLVAVALLACVVWRHRSIPPRTRLAGYGLGIAALAFSWWLRPDEISGAAEPALVAAAAGRYAGWPASNFIGLLAQWPETARYLPAIVARIPDAESPWIGVIGTFLADHRAIEVGLLWATGLLLQAPGLLLLVNAWRRGAENAPRFVVILAVWALLNLGAMALVRTEADQGRLLPPRFQDILALGLFSNVCALAAWRKNPASPASIPGKRFSVVVLAVLASTVALTAVGIVAVQLPRKRAENTAATRLIQDYLRSGDATLFRNQPVNHVPWPGGEEQLAEVLHDPTLRRILPVALHPPEARPAYSALSRVARGALALGWIPLLLGLGCVARGLRLARGKRVPQSGESRR